MPLTTLIAGGFKLDQLLFDPFQTFYSTLVRHVHEADAILLAGYGFGDLHVNRAEAFERSDYELSYPPAVVLTKSCPDTMRMGRRQSHDFWAFQLTHALGINFNNKQNNGGTVARLIENQEFEIPGFVKRENLVCNRVGIWHGGFIEAPLNSFDNLAQRLTVQ